MEMQCSIRTCTSSTYMMIINFFCAPILCPPPLVLGSTISLPFVEPPCTRGEVCLTGTTDSFRLIACRAHMPSLLTKGGRTLDKKGEPTKKKKELPKELCGCGVDTYRPPPKGKKKASAPVIHSVGCPYQRTTCDAYPHLIQCEICCDPCKFCLGKNQWCPHCYENQCQFRFKRVVHGWEAKGIDVGPSISADMLSKASTGGRRSMAVTFASTQSEERKSVR